jgi:hypothetical protein
LGDGPPGFPPTSTCWAVLRIPLGLRPCHLRGSHPLRPAIPRRSVKVSGPKCGPTTPEGTRPPGLGWSPFARRYSGSRCCFLFLGVLRCFSSPRWLGYPGINARLTAPPGLSRPPTPYSLLAPRHPPHALSSLATPPSSPALANGSRDGSSYLPHRSPGGVTISLAFSLLRLVSNVLDATPTPRSPVTRKTRRRKSIDATSSPTTLSKNSGQVRVTAILTPTPRAGHSPLSPQVIT